MGFADVPAPIQYAPRENLGLQLVQSAAGVAQAYQQGKAAASANEFQTAFGQAYAKGDLEGMKQLAAAHPAQWQQVQQGMTAINNDNRQALGAAANDLSLAALSGNPQAIANVAQRHASTLQGLGITPEQLAQTPPEQIRQYADMVGMHALEPDKYFDLQNKTAQQIQQGRYQQGQLQNQQQGLQIRQQEANQQGMYQQQQIQNQQQRLNLDASYNQAKILDMKATQANNSNKTAAEVAKAQQASLQAKQTLVDGYDQASGVLNNSLNTLQQVQQIPPETFDAMWGVSGMINRNIPGSPEQVAWAQLQSMQSQARLSGMALLKGTGSVSNAEGEAAQKAFLSITPNTPAKAARKAIDNWRDVLQRQGKALQGKQKQIELYRSQINADTERQAQQYNAAPAAAAGGSTDWADLQH